MKKKLWIPIALAAVVLLAGGYLLLRVPAPALLDSAGAQCEAFGDPSEIPDGDVPLADAAAVTEEDPFAAFTEEQKTTMNEILDLVNAARQEAGVAPLELVPALCTAAQVRATECVGCFSHTRPDGSAYKTAITDAGITPGYSGENVATGHSSAKQVMDRWLLSEGHKANILNPNFTKLGVGYAPNQGNRYRGYAWVQMFIS